MVTTGTFLEVSGESTGGCARRSDDSLACWGNNYSGGLQPPPDGFGQVSLGFTVA